LSWQGSATFPTQGELCSRVAIDTIDHKLTGLICGRIKRPQEPRAKT